MKHYSVQTGWIGKVPELKGQVEVFAINRKEADLAILIDYIDLGETVGEVSADDAGSQSLMPKDNIPWLGCMNYIAN